MSLLPKLNNMPKYSVTIPSMNKEVMIRPFIVKEEKIMLIAMESQDPKQIAQSILDTVKSCILDEVESRLLTSYDVEYLFLKIRAKSAGETAKLLFKCEECEEENEVTVNLDEIKMDIKEGWTNDNVVKITDEISLEMRHPSFLALASSSDVVTSKSPTHQIFGILKESVAAVLTDDNRIDVKDVNFEEFEEFIESMTGEQFTKIREYVLKIPKLTHEVNYDCEKCSKDNNVKLEGLQSFL